MFFRKSHVKLICRVCLLTVMFSLSMLISAERCISSGGSNVLKAGTAFPKTVLPDFRGQKVVLPDSAGYVAIIHFVSVWCDLCESEMAVMQLIQSLHGGKGVATYWVNVGEAVEPGRQYASKVNPGYSVLLDSRSEISAQLGDLRVPVTVVCDRDGVIRGRLLGEMTKGGLIRLLRLVQLGA